jgi:ankyrin repeat protein
VRLERGGSGVGARDGDGGSGTEVGDTGSWGEVEDAGSGAEVEDKGYSFDPGYSQRVPRQMTGVHLAAYFGLSDTMMALLKKRHDQDLKDTYGKTPLSWSAENGHDAVARILLERAATVDMWIVTREFRQYGTRISVGSGESKSYSRKETALHIATRNGHKTVVDILLEWRANSNKLSTSTDERVGKSPGFGLRGIETTREEEKRTPLHLAAEYGHEPVVNLLLERGANINELSTESESFKRLDLFHGSAESFKEKKRTALHLAAKNGHEAVVTLLLRRGADINQQSMITISECQYSDEFGPGSDRYIKGYSQTALHMATLNGDEVVVLVLLKKGHGLDINRKDLDGKPALHHAAETGNMAIAYQLVENGADSNATDFRGQTPLSLAAASGHSAIVEMLLGKDNVDPDYKDEGGRTPLSWAAEKGYRTIVKMLLAKNRVDPDSKDTNGRTPLSWAAGTHWAIEKEHMAVVQLLLEKDGVNPDSRDENGRTLLSLAAGFWSGIAKKGHDAIVELLLEKGANIESQDKDGRTPLSWAAGNRPEIVVKLLLEKGANTESCSNSGQTPLAYAVKEGHKGVVKLLQPKP